MKKNIFLLLLFLLIIPYMVNAESKYLYDVLKDEAESNGLAREYTGEHKDSFTKEPSKKIYHWYAGSYDDMYRVSDKDNIIFANLCWKIVRTTDTGGVKLIYNGFPRNNNCKEYHSRSDLEIGFLVQTSAYDQNYYYATDFEIDEDKYIIPKGTIKKATELDSHIGWFLFQTSNLNNRVSSAYYMIDDRLGIAFYSDYGKNNSIGKSNYSQFIPKKASYVGYMNNDKYEINKIKYETSQDHYYYMKKANAKRYIETPSLNANGTFSDYNSIYINQSNANSITGYYIMNDNYHLYYVVDILEDSYKTLPFSYMDGLPQVLGYYTYGNSYIQNSDGTYTLQDTNRIDIDKFNTNYNDLMNKYSCLSYKDTCENLKFIISSTNDSYSYMDGTLHFSKDVQYNNGYTMSENILESKDVQNNLDILSNHHYFTFPNNNKDEIQYLYYYDSSNKSLYYVTLKDGDKIDNIVNDITNNNSKDSYTKRVIDLWYNHFLSDYSNYIEDSIYCNNREIEDIAGFDILGNINKKLVFKKNDSLKCENINNSFSMNNPNAQLKYPVGLLNQAEFKLMGYTDSSYLYTLLMDANDIHDYLHISSTYTMDSTSLSNGIIKPVITLDKDSVISAGDGSQENPYIFDGIVSRYKINVEIVNETENLTVEINDMTQVKHGEEVVFNVTPIKGFKLKNVKIVDKDNNEVDYNTTDNKQYIFIMPASDVTIIPVYERVANAVNVEDNIHTKEIVIEVNNAKAVVYEDKVVFTIVPEDGYEIDTIEILDEEGNKIEYSKSNNKNEYSFIMPDKSVIIIPTYKKIPEEIKNPQTSFNRLYVLLMLLFVIGIIITRQKFYVFYKKKIG